MVHHAIQDWERDTIEREGERTMSHEEFRRSLFELADTWSCEGIVVVFTIVVGGKGEGG